MSGAYVNTKGGTKNDVVLPIVQEFSARFPETTAAFGSNVSVRAEEFSVKYSSRPSTRMTWGMTRPSPTYVGPAF
jgi:hypothetical protein